jgi:tetratricopeptide (TPR) repeat protein
VAYGVLLHESRRLVHSRIVDALEALPPGHFVDQADWLAYHAFRSERWEKALRYCRQVGLRAAARSAAREAVASLEQALIALNHLAPDQQDDALGIDLRLDLQSALVPLGDLDRMLGWLAEAEDLAERLGDQRRLGRVLAYMAHCLWWSGEPDRAVSSGQRALTVARSLGDFELETIAHVRLGQSYFSLGDYRSAIVACQATMDALKDSLLRETFGLPSAPAIVNRAFMGRSLALLGEFDTGIAMAEEGLRMAEASKHRYGIIIAYWGAGDAYLCRGRLTSATVALEHALELCKSGGFALMRPIVTRVLAEGYALGGRTSEALRLLETAVAQLEAMKYAPALPSACLGLGDAYLLAGQFEPAWQAANRALELCRAHQQYGNEAFTLRTLGAIHAARDVPDAEAAAGAYRGALELAEPRGMRPLVAHCHLGLGKLYRRTGKADQAHEHLILATTMYREMDMQFWLEQAEADRDT